MTWRGGATLTKISVIASSMTIATGCSILSRHPTTRRLIVCSQCSTTTGIRECPLRILRLWQWNICVLIYNCNKNIRHRRQLSWQRSKDHVKNSDILEWWGNDSKWPRDCSQCSTEIDLATLLKTRYQASSWKPTKKWAKIMFLHRQMSKHGYLNTYPQMQMSDSNRDGRVTFNEFENMVVMCLQKCGIDIYESMWCLYNIWRTNSLIIVRISRIVWRKWLRT